MFKEDNPPPECPMHNPDVNDEVEMERDYKKEQLKQTDLNWDGQDDS